VSAIRIYDWMKLDSAARRQVLERPALAANATVQTAVAAIIERVRRDGDRALRELAVEFDSQRIDDIAVSSAEFDAAADSLTAEQRAAIELAARNIETFHRAQMPRPIDIETMGGVRCERVTRPIARVGLYVPAGSAPLPSTALMLAIPAMLAACSTRVLCSPARGDGRVDSAVLFAARLCGIDRVYRIGGAQAVAAMAYGTESVPRVDKIFGPGSVWVTAAKAQVSSDPGGAAQDMPAGPSEVLVVADESARADFVAADLLSQAEHGADSQAVLVTTSRDFAAHVGAAVDAQLGRLARRETAEAAMQHSFAVVVPDIDTAIDVANAYAPEHLLLQVDDARAWLDAIQAAGSVFIGNWAPESVGDYCSGTNHVLPTYGFARNYSSLGLADFMRSMTVQELSPTGLRNIGPTAVTLAELEGLDAHAAAVRIRLEALADTETR
jgi:histidinol dehydrogenase